jgi:hypothetical protein
MGPGQLFLGNSTGVLARAIEGWRMSWTYAAASGAPLTITSGGGDFEKLYASGTPNAPDGWTRRDGSVAWGADIGASTLGGSYLGDGFISVEEPQCADGSITDYTDAMGWNMRTEGNCDMQAIAMVSDPSRIVLQNALPGTRGNVGLSTIEGPGSWTLNASMSKEFQFMEDRQFQLRVDAENVLNNPGVGNPTLSVNTTGTPFGYIAGKGGGSRNFQGQIRVTF